jgi:inner membrane protein
MPTVFTHAAVAFALARLTLEFAGSRGQESGNQPSSKLSEAGRWSLTGKGNSAILLTAGILGALPDADALYRHWVLQNGLFGHRGLTHSLCFAAVIASLLAWLFVRWQWNKGQKYATLALTFALATASHGFLDAMTTGGSGVGFFIPFTDTRYFFPIRPIPVAPFSAAALLSARGLNLIIWELALLWTFVLGAVLWHRRTTLRMFAGAGCWVLCVLIWLWRL